MLAGLSSALSGLNSAREAADAAAANLANSLTPGYRAVRTVQNQGANGQGTSISYSSDASNGPLQQTGRSTDLAIVGQGFFQVEGADGAVTPTRDGSFVEDGEGYLRSTDGGYLLGDSGRLQVPNGAVVSVSRTGTITTQGGATVGTLALTDGSGGEGAPGSGGFGSVVSGALEISNVDPVTEAVNGIVAQRSFEANVKSIQVSNEMLKKAYEMLGSDQREGASHGNA